MSNEEEYVYEEVTNPHVIETGDSVKVKQVLDDATIEAVTEYGYSGDYKWDNFKLFIMFLSCVSAITAQFYPLPFPQSRILLGVCCAIYFILSGVLQFIVTFVDKDLIMLTKSKESTGLELRIRTTFPKYQEYFTLIVQRKDCKDPKGPSFTSRMYVGKYFTSKGEFNETIFHNDVKLTISRFEEQQQQQKDKNKENGKEKEKEMQDSMELTHDLKQD